MLPQLSPDECRVLGTLIEKAQTTPAQYPLSLNSIVVGVSQKSNRWPVVTIDEDRALRALDGLRAKGLAREVSLAASRVEKFRHVAREALGVSTSELVLLAELLLRGPQTVGELRGRASRMHPFESLEATQTILEAMAAREQPLVRELPPSPGSRAKRWMQLLAPALHPLDAPGASDSDGDDTEPRHADGTPRVSDERLAAIESRLAALEATVAELVAKLRDLGG
ncbi:MAG: DUF480 domain-containing protein [Phycisphaerae bacterium]|nr:DUF480 domain-containing protein [Phycisphaerae bacterium]